MRRLWVRRDWWTSPLVFLVYSASAASTKRSSIATAPRSSRRRQLPQVIKRPFDQYRRRSQRACRSRKGDTEDEDGSLAVLAAITRRNHLALKARDCGRSSGVRQQGQPGVGNPYAP